MGTNPASKKQKLPHFPTERLAKKGVTIQQAMCSMVLGELKNSFGHPTTHCSWFWYSSMVSARFLSCDYQRVSQPHHVGLIENVVPPTFDVLSSLPPVFPIVLDLVDGEICRKQQDGLWFYPIDNSLSGARSPDPVVAELRHAIEVVAKEDPEEYLERPIPIRPWELTVFWREEGRDSWLGGCVSRVCLMMICFVGVGRKSLRFFVSLMLNLQSQCVLQVFPIYLSL